MVERADERHKEHQQYQYAPVHPIEEDDYQDGRHADAPETPHQEHRYAAQRLGDREAHLPIRREAGGHDDHVTCVWRERDGVLIATNL